MYSNFELQNIRNRKRLTKKKKNNKKAKTKSKI